MGFKGLILTIATVFGSPVLAQTVELEPGRWVFEQSLVATGSTGEDLRNASVVTECLSEGNSTWSPQDLIDEYFTGGGLSCSFVHVDLDQAVGQAEFTCQNTEVGVSVRGSSSGRFTGETYSVRSTGTLSSPTLSYDLLVEVNARRVGSC